MFERGFMIKDVENQDKVHEGMTPLTFAHYIMDWKSATNASDNSADMVLKLVTKLVCTFKHKYPTSWN